MDFVTCLLFDFLVTILLVNLGTPYIINYGIKLNRKEALDKYFVRFL